MMKIRLSDLRRQIIIGHVHDMANGKENFATQSFQRLISPKKLINNQIGMVK